MSWGRPGPQGAGAGPGAAGLGGLGPGPPADRGRSRPGGRGSRRSPGLASRTRSLAQAGDAVGGLFGPAPVGSPALTASGWGGGLRRPQISTCCWRRSAPATG